MNSTSAKLKEFINKTFMMINHFSIEKIALELDEEIRRKYFDKYIKKGIPASRIFKMIGKSEDSELAEVIPDLYNLPIKERKKVSSLFIYLIAVDNSMEAFLRFFKGLRLKIYTMNLLLAIVYSIFPWFISFANNKINLINEFQIMLPTSIYLTFYFAFLMLLVSFLMSINFLERKAMIIQFSAMMLIYILLQVMFWILFSSRLASLYILL